MPLYARKLEGSVLLDEEWVAYSSVTHQIESHFVFDSEDAAAEYCVFSDARPRGETCDETDRHWERAKETGPVGSRP